ncbi:MAG: hypothetical protein QOK23_2503 [Gammaproteobacteria bacterium]|jgi:hypothetical protein|nr:hypothetical protein [Gammaproteobacteria bacterium]
MDDTERAARDAVRLRERAIWTDVERVGRELRATEAPKHAMTQADRDAARVKPTEGMGE